MAAKKNAAGCGTGGAENFANTSTTNSSGARWSAQRDRRPPAYQTYASDDLAAASYYLLNLAERGLLDSMRRACWIDRSVPRAVDDLALAIRRPIDEVVEHLTDRVLAHFVEDSGGRLRCEELDRQRERLDARRKAQQHGADATNGNRNANRNASRDGERDGERDANRVAPEQNRTERSSRALPEGCRQEEGSRVCAGARAQGNGSAEVVQ